MAKLLLLENFSVNPGLRVVLILWIVLQGSLPSGGIVQMDPNQQIPGDGKTRIKPIRFKIMVEAANMPLGA